MYHGDGEFDIFCKHLLRNDKNGSKSVPVIRKLRPRDLRPRDPELKDCVMRNIVLLFLSLWTCTAATAGTLTQYVNPYIGTGGHGHVFLGANVPFGMVQVGPTEPVRGWDWCSGYHYSDSVLLGFSHLHLSGTGIGDLGDIALLPVDRPDRRKYLFGHGDEQVRPGYYSLRLRESGIRAELTATTRCGMHRYTFPAHQTEAMFLLDLDRGIGWDGTTQIELTQTTESMVVGYRYSRGWARDQRVFFAAEFSKPIRLTPLSGDTLTLITAATDGQPLLVRVGISPVSTEGAVSNLRAELPGWDFDAVAAAADDAWEQQLGKVRVKTVDDTTRRIFYTALYHTMVAPSVFCDVNGDYRGADGQVRHGDFVCHTTFSLWDTYRAAHPLMTLIHPERQHDIAETMLHIWKEQGKLPVWHLWGNETDCMVGNPGIPVIADIALKRFDVDVAQVLAAAKASAMRDERGMKYLKKYGYLPYDLDKEDETVAKGMEYALADYCVARVATLPGSGDYTGADYRYFAERSHAWLNYFDPATGFMRPKDSQGHFPKTFSPFSTTLDGRKDYTEGNAWQYLWLVPHEPKRLVDLLGGDNRFAMRLDSLFLAEGSLGEEAPPDITGLIGQYAHGNEPSHHVAYLYHYAGMPWRAAPLLRRVCREMYADAPDGLCGNEDVGQMSAWYILTAMGLYQVEPCGGQYLIGSPLFDEVEMKVGGGKTFRVVAHNNSADNIYVQSALLNGKKYNKSYLDFTDIVGGGTLTLQMGSRPSTFGKSPTSRPGR